MADTQPAPEDLKEPLNCPLGKSARLRVIVWGDLLCECVLEEPDICPNAFPFGKVNLCRALLKTDKV